MSFVVRNSSCSDGVAVDIISGTASVLFSNGAVYRYTNVSRRALLNLTLNRRMSLGSWYNFNCLGGNEAREVANERKLWQAFA